MGNVTTVQPVLLFLAAVSRYPAALDWARRTSAGSWGPVALASDPFAFVETDYYESSMGTDLVKCFFAYQRLVDPNCLPSVKRQTNAWEAQYAAASDHAESRPLNLDPGYVTPAKLVLASTKDHAHRVYLGEGIYAEVTLNWRQRRWQHQSWTYPDYRREDYQAFFSLCRDELRCRER